MQGWGASTHSNKSYQRTFNLWFLKVEDAKNFELLRIFLLRWPELVSHHRITTNTNIRAFFFSILGVHFHCNIKRSEVVKENHLNHVFLPTVVRCFPLQFINLATILSPICKRKYVLWVTPCFFYNFLAILPHLSRVNVRSLRLSLDCRIFKT